MKPQSKVYGFVITIVTAIMYYLWPYMNNIAIDSKGNITQDIILVLVGGLTALGTYRMVLKLMILASDEIEWLKKIICGKQYLNGVWVGIYIGHDGNPIFYIENYIQSYEMVTVKGRCYESTGSYKGSWYSEEVSFDLVKERLIYNYYTDMTKNNFLNLGQASFNISRETNGRKATKLIGYSKDLFSSDKFKTVEVKIFDGNKTKYLSDKNDDELLEKARSVYTEHLNFFS